MVIGAPPICSASPFGPSPNFKFSVYNVMGNHIRSVAHPLYFLNLTLFSIARITERIWYIPLLVLQIDYGPQRYISLNKRAGHGDTKRTLMLV